MTLLLLFGERLTHQANAVAALPTLGSQKPLAEKEEAVFEEVPAFGVAALSMV